jgi:hypothetical protein
VTFSIILQEELERKIAEIRSERKVNGQKQKSVQPELVQVGSLLLLSSGRYNICFFFASFVDLTTRTWSALFDADGNSPIPKI